MKLLGRNESEGERERYIFYFMLLVKSSYSDFF